MKKSGAILTAALVAVILSLFMTVTPARALPFTYDFTYTNNTGTVTAIGHITFNELYANDPGFNASFGSGFASQHFFADSSYVTALEVIVSGSANANANGTFTMADFSGFLLDTNNTTLDLSQPMEGQFTSGEWGDGGWGYGGGLYGRGLGDFSLIGGGSGANGQYAPTLGFDQFMITLYGGESLSMYTPAVPEPSTLLLFGSGLAGLAFIRRKTFRV